MSSMSQPRTLASTTTDESQSDGRGTTSTIMNQTNSSSNDLRHLLQNAMAMKTEWLKGAQKTSQEQLERGRKSTDRIAENNARMSWGQNLSPRSQLTRDIANCKEIIDYIFCHMCLSPILLAIHFLLITGSLRVNIKFTLCNAC
ncbi:hypothetical protein V1515DRAFT_583355 [Lipomyces mesembrius]